MKTGICSEIDLGTYTGDAYIYAEVNGGLRGSSSGQPSDCPPSRNPGPHGLTQILYAFTSGAGNNGSAFAGLAPNWWYNVVMGWDMLIGRFLMMIPVIALAGNLAQKKSVPPSPGTFPVNTALFTFLLVGVILAARRAHLLPGAEPGTDS